MEDQFSALHSNPDIIIATPGRLLHLVIEMGLRLNHVEYVVFDEADRLFELGFEQQLREVLKRLPTEHQTVLFSATLPQGLVDFSRAGLSDPQLIRLDTDTKLSENLKTVFLCCGPEDKLAVLVKLMDQIVGSTEQSIIFCATKHHVEFVAENLRLCGHACSALYSALDPEARKQSVQRFRHGMNRVLVVTDLAARGVDIPLLDNAINFHFPPKPKLFLHRVDMFTDSLGLVPPEAVEDEHESIQSLQRSSSDMEGLIKTASNAWKQYIRSRQAPSAESVRRSKRDFPWTSLQIHPLFARFVNREADHEDVLSQIKKYKPQATILELNHSSKDASWSVMKAKRKAHGTAIARKAQLMSSHAKLPDTTESYRLDGDKGTVRDVSHFIPYRSLGYHSEKGLAIGDGGINSFESASRQAILDLADDNLEMTQNPKRLKTWDRKRKKFFGPRDGDGDANKKRIRTENGVLLPSSYRTGLYGKWKRQHRIESIEESAPVATHGQHKPGNKQLRVKSELVPKEKVIKERKRKLKIQALQKRRQDLNSKKRTVKKRQ